MRRSLLILLAAVLASGAVVAALYGIRGGIETGLLIAGAGAAALVGGHISAERRPRLALTRQFELGAAVAVGSILLATIAAAALMFVSEQDAVMVSLITLFAGGLAVRGAQLVASGLRADIDRVRRGLAAVGEGRRDVRMDTGGRDEVGELAASADAMVRQLAAEEEHRATADRARKDLVAAVSHDLRTPVASLRLLVDAIDDELVDEPTRRRYQRTMKTHLVALSGLIDDLFELSRLEAGDITWSMQQVHLPELVDETVAAMAVEGEARGVAVRAELCEPLAAARADPEKLQRVLFNLIQNAIRHTPADGSVTVRAECRPEGLELEVADTGGGIPEDQRDRVFEPFYRTGADIMPGDSAAGLGLAISRAIVEAHGGRIWIENGGSGTRVRFTLRAA